MHALGLSSSNARGHVTSQGPRIAAWRARHSPERTGRPHGADRHAPHPIGLRTVLSHARDLEDAGHPREVSDLQQSSLSRCQEREDLERLVPEIVNVHRRHDLQ